MVLRARADWRSLWDELASRNRVERMAAPDGTEVWCAADAAAQARAALEGEDEAVARTLRGHLELVGITTADVLAEATTLTKGRVSSGLAMLQRDGFAMQGHYTRPDGETEWVARRLLARMHSYSRRSRRSSVQPATAQDFMRFLLRWQHLAPGTQLSGEAGLVTVLEQLQGYEAAAAGWEPELFARRLNHYEPSWLDRLCHTGDVAWLRLTPRTLDDPNAPAAGPSKATPVAVVFRADLPWLLAAARPDAELVEPTVGATAEVLELLHQRGACFATDLIAATRRLPDDVERALWDGVSRGLLMSDGFAAIRARVTGPTAAERARPHRVTRLGRSARTAGASAGRWALAPPPGQLDHEELAEAVAEQLLSRWGVVFRDLAVRDSSRLPWRDLQWALRRLEDRGLVRGGRFVSGFGGEQYALPEAAEQLAHVKRLARTGERVVVNAIDPLNLVGLIVPGDTVPSVRTNRVTYVDGIPE